MTFPRRRYAILDETGNVPAELLGNAPGGSHPDQFVHVALGLGTSAELVTHAGTPHGLSSHAIDGAFHTGAGVLPTQGQKNALAGTQGTPGDLNRYVTNGDTRLSDARNPLAHSHGSAPVIVKKAAAQTNATTTLATVTGFDIPVSATTDYLLDIAIRYRSSLATAGMKVALLGPSGATVVWDYDAPGTNTSGGTDNLQTFQSGAFGAAPVVQSLAVPTINVDWLASIKALISTAGTGGNVQLQFAAEVSATITIQKGTVAVLTG